MGSHYSPDSEGYLRHCQPLRRTMSPSPDLGKRERQRSLSPHRRSRSPEFYPPLESTCRQRSRTLRRRSQSPASHRAYNFETRQKAPSAKSHNVRPRRERVDDDERLVIDLVTPEPETIPTIKHAIIEDICAANILHPFQTYTVLGRQSSLSTLGPISSLDPQPIALQPSVHGESEGIHRIAAAFRGPESQRADRIRTTFADAFGGSRKPDLPSRPPPHSHLPQKNLPLPHRAVISLENSDVDTSESSRTLGPPSHPLPYQVAKSLEDADVDTSKGFRKLGPPSHPLPYQVANSLEDADFDSDSDLVGPSSPLRHRVVGSLENTYLDANPVSTSYRSVLGRNPEPFSGKVVNNLGRTIAKELAAKMLEMPLYKDGVYYYIFWTDGSFQRVNDSNKGGAAAVWFDPTRHEWYSWREKPPYGETTSNDAELLGIGIALRKASSFIAKFQQDHPTVLNARHEVFIFTDSSACLQLIPRAHFYPLCKQWARESLLADILGASASLKQLGAKIQLHWVPSHSGVIGNEVADREARYAAHGEYVGQQTSSGPWERPSPVDSRMISRTIMSTARRHRDMVNKFNCLLNPEDSEDYISLS